MKKSELKYYLDLPWTYTVETETHKGKSYYIIRVNELPGICTDAENLEKGMKEIKEAIAVAVEVYIEQGLPVPEPIQKDKFKGKILYRTDSERHYLIAKASQMMHKSISKTLDILVDEGIRNRGLRI